MKTQDANKIHCSDIMEKHGLKPVSQKVRTRGLELEYHSPIREDIKPSLHVNVERNIWVDLPTGEGGRPVDLMLYLNQLPKNAVREALAHFDRLFPSGYRVSRPTSVNAVVVDTLSQPILSATGMKKKQGRTLVSERDIYRYPLKNYLSERRIPLEIAEVYLKELDYKDHAGRQFYALGWKAGDTYALSSKGFKGFLGENPSISIYGEVQSEVYVFEGMFDFLSYLAHKKRKSIGTTAIVLNSISFGKHLDAWITAHPQIAQINCFLDNDDAGRSCFKQILDNHSGHIVRDYSQGYVNCKDFAEWFQNQT